MNFIDLFAGIGGFRLALESLGAQCVFSSEIDKFARQTYAANFGYEPSGDITKIAAQDIPKHDILCAGFPCQPFSIAGKRLGFQDPRGGMFGEILRIIDHHQTPILFLENVKGLKSHNKGETFNIIVQALRDRGYTVHTNILNAKHFGVPQNRERLFFVAFKPDRPFIWPVAPMIPTRVGDILDNADQKYYLTDKQINYQKDRKEKNMAQGKGFGMQLVTHESEYTGAITARYHKDGSDIICQDKTRYRKLTPRECARLQGYPDTFKIPVSDSQAYKQFGNSVAIPVIKAIAKEILKWIQ